MSLPATTRALDRLPRGMSTTPSPAAWQLPAFAGRLGEISGGRDSAVLTLATRLVLDAQRRDEPVAWITRPDRVFYPPDVAESSVDVEALVVIWAPDGLRGARAADRLVRSGGFGLVVLDLGTDRRLPIAAQARLAGLALKHQAAILCLTESDGRQRSLGSLISIRVEATRVAGETDGFLCRARILKDKRRGPGWEHSEAYRGPDGLH